MINYGIIYRNYGIIYRREGDVYMTGQERREKIIYILTTSGKPVSGSGLARELAVSRQVIVQDIALLRADGHEIFSTHRGYLINESKGVKTRVFKVHHSDTEVEEELNLYVDFGATVKDVFVYHRIYGILRADMNIRSRRDVKAYIKELSGGSSSLLMNITSGYHYHTIIADDEETLDLIQEELWKKGFLAKLQTYEPVDFGVDVV